MKAPFYACFYYVEELTDTNALFSSNSLMPPLWLLYRRLSVGVDIWMSVSKFNSCNDLRPRNDNPELSKQSRPKPTNVLGTLHRSVKKAYPKPGICISQICYSIAFLQVLPQRFILFIFLLIKALLILIQQRRDHTKSNQKIHSRKSLRIRHL